ncbi:MAG: hypothetical protein RLZZ269_718, partial [Actinomycetota bacterium]
MHKPSGHLLAGFAALGAGALHASAIGLHAETPQLARIFVVMALLQLGVGVALVLRPRATFLVASLVVNSLAVGGWLLTRLVGISWVDGLEVREGPQIADTVCAGLGALSAALALGLLVVGSTPLASPRSLHVALPLCGVGFAVVIGMWNGATHVHGHGHDGDQAASADHHSDSATSGDGHDHSSSGAALATGESAEAAHDHATDWPRPYDPAVAIDISGVEGVSAEQEARARELILATQRELPRWSDYDEAVAQGWVSIGDESTGHEHLVNRRLIVDGKFLDPTAPESLVYEVKGSTKTLVSAMFMADIGVAVDDPKLTDYAGPLMQWHVHDNLCFRNNAEGRSVVAGVLDAQGNCPPGSILGGIGIAMVHVWIAPHPCGPFAALEGEGAGRAAVSDQERVDMCAHDHAAESGSLSVAASEKDTGAARIDLSGMPGVTTDERRRAEDLLYSTRTVLPKFSDPATAEAAGFSTIGDGATGYEHYINWKYINDEHELNPEFPESLVYQIDPATRQKKLVSAMFMMGDEYTLDNVPNVGGPLTQWHIHNNLCFSRDPAVFGSTRVVGVTSENGPCQFGIKLRENPMIHVWVVPHKCGPFAALEGVGAGQVRAGVRV